MINILGVQFDEVDLPNARKRVAEFLNSDKQHKIFTPNAEMLVDAQKDEKFKEILNNADLNMCDGRGVELFSKGTLTRIPGVDFTLEVCKIAEQKNCSVYLLGSGSTEVLKNFEKNLKQKFPNLKIAGTHPGNKVELKEEGKIILDLDIQQNNDLIAEIVMAKPDILLVAFSHNKQERWIDQYISDIPSVKIAMGVGGTFDFLSGKVSRAPLFIRKIGLESLYRLFKEPWRFRRVAKALIVFPILYFKHTFKS